MKKLLKGICYNLGCKIGKMKNFYGCIYLYELFVLVKEYFIGYVWVFEELEVLEVLMLKY